MAYSDTTVSGRYIMVIEEQGSGIHPDCPKEADHDGKSF
jgi:hypothetical protein